MERATCSTGGVQSRSSKNCINYSFYTSVLVRSGRFLLREYFVSGKKSYSVAFSMSYCCGEPFFRNSFISRRASKIGKVIFSLSKEFDIAISFLFRFRITALKVS